MATITQFEDLEAWKVARQFCSSITPLLAKLRKQREYALLDQLDRSSGSIMDNIAEGFDKDNNTEFLHFLRIAKSSASEARSQLYRALDRAVLSEDEFRNYAQDVAQTARIIGGLIRYLKRTSLRGSKFAPSNHEP